MATVLYFASLRERLGVSRETINLPPGRNSVATVVAMLRARGGPWEPCFGPGSVWRVSVNQAMASLEDTVSSEDEIAFFPPVTGG